MLQRGRKKSGRGYDRDAWIKHHQQIVERVEKQAKLHKAESTNENSSDEVQSEQKPDGAEIQRTYGETEQQPADTVLFSVDINTTPRTPSTDEHTTEKVFTQRSNGTLPGPNVPETVSDESNIRNSTVRTVVRSTLTQDLPQTTTGTKSQTRSIEGTVDDDVVMLEELPTGQGAPFGKGSHTSKENGDDKQSDEAAEVTKQMDTTNLNEKINRLLNTTAVPTQVTPPVTIKQELLEAITNKHLTSDDDPTDDQSMSTNSEQSDAWMDDDESEDELHELQTHNSFHKHQGNNTMVSYKRKSAMAVVDHQKQKRQQTRGIHDVQGWETSTPWETQMTDTSSSGFHSNDTNVSKGKDTTETLVSTKEQIIDEDTNEILLQDEEVQKTTDHSSKGHKSTQDFTPTDSDTEWATIAKKIKDRSSTDKPKVSGSTPQSQQYVRPPTTVRFSKKNTVMNNKFTTAKSRVTTMKERGLHLTEEKAKINTPVKIEFNINANEPDFNVLEECTGLLEAMGTADPSIRITGSVSKILLWEVDGQMPDWDKFCAEFQMREQKYRKGNSKVTIFCVVESSMNINRIKFIDPVQSVLLAKNIWIKPDYYSTKVVSSPGFFTLLHPRLTHKQSLVKHIQNALRTTTVDTKEAIVVEWHDIHPDAITETSTPTPPFHVETSLKKWGTIQTEVLSVHCSAEDAKYMKYLLTAASTQNKLATGLFVPTGLHLLEGKEVLTNLMREQYEFVQQTVSFQIEGVSRADMDTSKDGGQTTREILSQGPGVRGIESTYQTDHRGQWVLVVATNEVQSLQGYLKKNTQTIYSNRQSKQMRLIRHSIDNHTNGYRVVLLDSFLGSVGTYAEALTRRFHPTSTHSDVSSTRTEAPRANSKETQHYSSISISHDVASTTRDAFPSLQEAHNVDISDGPKPGRVTRTQARLENQNVPSPQKLPVQSHKKTDTNVSSQCQDKHSYHTDTSTMVAELKWANTFAKMEQNLEKKLNTMDENTTLQMSALEKRIEENIEQIMETKMMDISVLIANMVTKRLMKAMGKAAKGKSVSTESCSDCRARILIKCYMN